MMKFQPKTNNEKLMFVGLTFVISFLLTKDVRNALLIVIISYLIHSILENNKESITKLLSPTKENFSADSESEDESDDESEENFSGSEDESESGEETDEGDESEKKDSRKSIF